MTGRPKEPLPRELADAILERIASGESLRAVCRDRGMPSEATVRRWDREDLDGFAAQYARAKAERSAVHVEEIIEIADRPCATAVEVQQAKNQIDARKWTASKLLPRTYGDRLEHTGPDGGGIVLRVVTGLDAVVEGPDDLLPNPETPEVSE